MKLDVSDFSSDAVFVIFDGDMQNLHSLQHSGFCF